MITKPPLSLAAFHDKGTRDRIEAMPSASEAYLARGLLLALSISAVGPRSTCPMVRRSDASRAKLRQAMQEWMLVGYPRRQSHQWHKPFE